MVVMMGRRLMVPVEYGEKSMLAVLRVDEPRATLSITIKFAPRLNIHLCAQSNRLRRPSCKTVTYRCP